MSNLILFLTGKNITCYASVNVKILLIMCATLKPNEVNPIDNGIV